MKLKDILVLEISTVYDGSTMSVAEILESMDEEDIRIEFEELLEQLKQEGSI